MVEGLESLVNMNYPGRIVIIGRDEKNENNVVVYGITGRSSSSQARILEYIKDEIGFTVKVKPTDEKIINEGNKALLIYDAIKYLEEGIVVSNGVQTNLILDTLLNKKYKNPVACLDDSFREKYLINNIDVTSYEPDEPNFTPRISGLIINKNAALSIITKGSNEEPQKAYYSFILQTGKGKLVATYTGVNKDPLPSFNGSPLDVILKGNIEELANNVYQALGEFKVGVACVFSGQKEPYIINKNLNKGN